MEHGLLGLALGLALFLLPGAAWTLALAPRLGLARAAPLAVVLAFTLAPGALFLLNLMLNVPLHLGTMALMSAALGMAGLGVALAGPVRAALGGEA